MMTTTIWIFVIAFALALIVIGIYFYRKQGNMDDFLVAKRNLGFWVMIGTVVGTSIGGSTVAGYMSYGWTYGIGGYWNAWPIYVGMPIWVFLFSRRLNKFAQYTIPDVVEMRYDEKTRTISSIIFIFQHVAVIGVQIVAMGSACKVLFGMSFSTGAVIGTIIIMTYCWLGGLSAVAVTDVIQAILLSITMIAVLVAGISFLNGGFGEFVSLGNSQMPSGGFNFFSPGGAKLVSWALIWFPGNFIWQGMWQRAYSARDEKAGVTGMTIGFIITLILCLLPFLGGIVAHGILPADTVGGDVFTAMIVTLFPKGVAAFLLVGWVVAIMSTADSYVLSGTGNLVRDIYQKMINPRASDKQLLGASRWAVIILCGLGLVSALWLPNLMSLWLLGSGINISANFFPIFAAWFSRRVNSTGAFWSIIAGAAGSIIWTILFGPDGYNNVVHPVLIGFPAAGITMFVVSYLTSPPPAEKAKAYWWDYKEKVDEN